MEQLNAAVKIIGYIQSKRSKAFPESSDVAQVFQRLETNKRAHGNKYLRSDIAKVQRCLRSFSVDARCRKQLWLTALAGVDTICTEEGILAEWAVRRIQNKKKGPISNLEEKSLTLDEYFLFVEQADKIVNSCVADETLSISSSNIERAKVFALPICYITDDIHYGSSVFRFFWRNLLLQLCPISEELPSAVLNDLKTVALMMIGELCTEEVFHITRLGFRKSLSDWVEQWISTAFVGYLPVEQVLRLWDLIIGFQSLALLPLAAVAIVAVKRESLLNIQDEFDLETVLQHVGNMDIRNLVQALTETPEIRTWVQQFSEGSHSNYKKAGSPDL